MIHQCFITEKDKFHVEEEFVMEVELLYKYTLFERRGFGEFALFCAGKVLSHGFNIAVCNKGRRRKSE